MRQNNSIMFETLEVQSTRRHLYPRQHTLPEEAHRWPFPAAEIFRARPARGYCNSVGGDGNLSGETTYVLDFRERKKTVSMRIMTIKNLGKFVPRGHLEY